MLLASPHMVSYECLTVTWVTWPNSALLPDIRFEIWVTLNLTFQGHSRLKYNGAIGLPRYDFLLMSNSNHMAISYSLGTWKFSLYHHDHLSCLLLGQNFRPPTHPYSRAIVSKSINFLHGPEGRLPPKLKLIGTIFDQIFCSHPDRRTNATYIM